MQSGDLTNSKNITFGYSGTITPDDIEVEALGFECRLDQEIFTPCNDSLFNFTASKQYTNLSEGEHNFTVIAFIDIAVGEFGVERIYDESPATFTWTIIPELDTIIESAEDGNGISIANETISTSDSMTFTFSALNNITEAGFLCSLDDDEFEECSSGSITYEDLEIGEHIFRVSAFIPDSEVVDTSPATFTWTIMPEPILDTIIESAEDGDGEELESGDSTTSDSITFTFFAELNGTRLEEDVRFNCSLDNGTVSLCDSGSETYSDLEIREQPYIFKVNASTTNLTDPTPAIFNWTIIDDDGPSGGGGGGGGDDDDGPSGGGGGGGGDDDDGPSGGGGGGDDDDGPSGGGGGGDDDDGPSGGGGGEDNGLPGVGGGEIIDNEVEEAECPPLGDPTDPNCPPPTKPIGTSPSIGGEAECPPLGDPTNPNCPPPTEPIGTSPSIGGPPFGDPTAGTLSDLSNNTWLILRTLS
jgi:hypothetical protein